MGRNIIRLIWRSKYREKILQMNGVNWLLMRNIRIKNAKMRNAFYAMGTMISLPSLLKKKTLSYQSVFLIDEEGSDRSEERRVGKECKA